MALLGLHAVPELLPILLLCFVCVAGQTEFQIGTGIFDITGPAAEVNLVRIRFQSSTTELDILKAKLCFLLDPREKEQKRTYKRRKEIEKMKLHSR